MWSPQVSLLKNIHIFQFISAVIRDKHFLPIRVLPLLWSSPLPWMLAFIRFFTDSTTVGFGLFRTLRCLWFLSASNDWYWFLLPAALRNWTFWPTSSKSVLSSSSVVGNELTLCLPSPLLTALQEIHWTKILYIQKSTITFFPQVELHS